MSEPISDVWRLWLLARSLVFWVWLVLWTLISGPFALLGSCFSFRAGYVFAHWWIVGNVYALKWICGVHWKVDGLENIPADPCLVMSKHQSTWETLFLPMKFRRAIFVAKRSLGHIPIFGWTIVRLGFIMIDRKSGRSAISQMTEQVTDRIAKRRWIVVFPEGTRRPPGAPPSYRIGGAVVASRTAAPIVPVATNAGEFWPRMSFTKWPGTITVSIGPVIETKDKEPEEIIKETESWIESRMAEITVVDRFPYTR